MRQAGAFAGFAALAALTALAALSAGCERQVPRAQAPAQALLSTPEGSVGQIAVRQLEERPRLALVSREGDPAPAFVAAVATDLGPAATVALASVVEARLRAAGFEVEVGADRSAFRVRAWMTGRGQVEALLSALVVAFTQPVVAGSPEVDLARRRVLGLREAPLDAPELGAVAACTGRLGLAGNEPVPDLATPAGVRELEAWRKAALHAGRTSLSAVGPSAFCKEAEAALEHVGSWPHGEAAVDAWPQGDTVAAYPSMQLDGRSARVALAVRVPSALAAASAAERLGAKNAPLRARLAALGTPWTPVEVLGVARPRGGCVSVTVDAPEMPPGQPPETVAALVAALVRQEVRTELALPPSPGVVSRQILTAADARDAASRAAWWALSSAGVEGQERWATVLALPPRRELPAKGEASVGARFEAELGKALAPASQAAVERRVAVERGQGEVWVLLASPCGVAEEGVNDAGATALAALSAVQQRRDVDVTLEPWIAPEGVGVIAHAPLGEGAETPVDLARRVAEAAARVLTGTAPEPVSLSVARAAALGHLERTAGPEAAALGVFAAAIAPDHPSWVEPFGLWDRVVGSASSAARHRWQALAAGPLRVAIVVNADAAQAATAGAAIDRWLAPRLTQRACATPALGAPRQGRYTAVLPREADLGQSLVGAPLPAGPAARDMARLTAAALDGEGGLLAAALSPPPGSGPGVGGGASQVHVATRIVGGPRAAALVVDVRARAAQLDEVATRVHALLAGLATRVTENDLARAEASVAKREREARAEPRRRLVDLWRGRAPAGGATARTSLATWRAWLAATLAEGALVSVDARPE